MENRRTFLKTAMVACAVSTLGAGDILRDKRYAGVRGFNYIPSYAATIWDVIDHFDAKVWDREFGYSKRLEANALRIWCDYLSFQRDERHFLNTWEKILSLAEKHDLQVMVVTSNLWIDALWPFGQIDLAEIIQGAPSAEYRKYLTAFLGAFKNHPRVLMWDLCNESFNQRGEGELRSMLVKQEMSFWRGVIDTVRSIGPTQPITMRVPGRMDRAPEEIHDLVDVVSTSFYRGWWTENARDYQEQCDAFVQLANRKNKALIAGETCQGSEDNETRRKIIEISIRELERRNIGWLAWHLMGGKIVSGRLDRYDKNCKPGDKAIMHFVEVDGKIRAGHSVREWRTWS